MLEVAEECICLRLLLFSKVVALKSGNTPFKGIEESKSFFQNGKNRLIFF